MSEQPGIEFRQRTTADHLAKVALGLQHTGRGPSQDHRAAFQRFTLDLPESLKRVLSSTNLIENLFSRVRDMDSSQAAFQFRNIGRAP